MIFAPVALPCMFQSFRLLFLADYQYFQNRMPLLLLQNPLFSPSPILVIDIAMHPVGQVRNISFIQTLSSFSLPMCIYHNVATSLAMAALERGWSKGQEIYYNNSIRDCQAAATWTCFRKETVSSQASSQVGKKSLFWQFYLHSKWVQVSVPRSHLQSQLDEDPLQSGQGKEGSCIPLRMRRLTQASFFVQSLKQLHTFSKKCFKKFKIYLINMELNQVCDIQNMLYYNHNEVSWHFLSQAIWLHYLLLCVQQACQTQRLTGAK